MYIKVPWTVRSAVTSGNEETVRVARMLLALRVLVILSLVYWRTSAYILPPCDNEENDGPYKPEQQQQQPKSKLLKVYPVRMPYRQAQQPAQNSLADSGAEHKESQQLPYKPSSPPAQQISYSQSPPPPPLYVQQSEPVYPPPQAQPLYGPSSPLPGPASSSPSPVHLTSPAPPAPGPQTSESEYQPIYSTYPSSLPSSPAFPSPLFSPPSSQQTSQQVSSYQPRIYIVPPPPPPLSSSSSSSQQQECSKSSSSEEEDSPQKLDYQSDEAGDSKLQDSELTEPQSFGYSLPYSLPGLFPFPSYFPPAALPSIYGAAPPVILLAHAPPSYEQHLPFQLPSIYPTSFLPTTASQLYEQAALPSATSTQTYASSSSSSSSSSPLQSLVTYTGTPASYSATIKCSKSQSNAINRSPLKSAKQLTCKIHSVPISECNCKH